MPPLKRRTRSPKKIPGKSSWFNAALAHLESVVANLSDARDLDTIMSSVRMVTRNLMGTDGTTFVLRDGDYCFYADEDAISPLWKGQRFPMKQCISGWAMMNNQPAIIEDIYEDDRIPHDAYRPTFVKSLVMMPVSLDKPVAAIGTYWGHAYRPGRDEIAILETLAHVTAMTLDQLDLSTHLQNRLAAVLKTPESPRN